MRPQWIIINLTTGYLILSQNENEKMSYTRLSQHLSTDSNRSEKKLILDAARLSNLQGLEELIQNGIAVTPKIMKEYLELLTAEILPIKRNLEFQKDKPSELQEHVFNYVRTFEIALIMFKAFLDFQLKNGTDQAIINIIEKVKNYLPESTREYVDFMKYCKDMIFLQGSGNLVKKLDTKFHYSTDPEYANYEKIMENKEIKKDVTKIYFFFEHACNDTHADNINRKYQTLINDLKKDLTNINLGAQKNSSETRFASSTQRLLNDALEIIEQDSLSINKVIQISALMVGLYNEIQHHANNSWFPTHSTIADSILISLKNLSKKTNEEINLLSNYSVSDNQHASITLQISEWVNTEERILERFNTQIKGCSAKNFPDT